MSSTESSDANQMQVDDIDTNAPRSLRPRKGTRGSVECITGRMVSALDKRRVSDRDAIHLLIATAEGMRRDPKKLIINRSSLRKRRSENRKKIADFLKTNPQVKLFINQCENFSLTLKFFISSSIQRNSSWCIGTEKYFQISKAIRKLIDFQLLCRLMGRSNF